MSKITTPLPENHSLADHARLTIQELIKATSRRGYPRLGEWEKKLLFSAYAALREPIPPEHLGYVPYAWRGIPTT